MSDSKVIFEFYFLSFSVQSLLFVSRAPLVPRNLTAPTSLTITAGTCSTSIKVNRRLCGEHERMFGECSQFLRGRHEAITGFCQADKLKRKKICFSPAETYSFTVTKLTLMAGIKPSVFLFLSSDHFTVLASSPEYTAERLSQSWILYTRSVYEDV